MIIGFPTTKADYSGVRLAPKLVPLTFINMMNGQDAIMGLSRWTSLRWNSIICCR